MAKEVIGKIKLQCPGGQATPAPPVGPALGAQGVNIGQFVKQFNDATKDNQGLIIPVVVTVYADRSFELEFKQPPAAVLLKVKAGIAKGSPEPNREKVARITQAQLREIAEQKQVDLNANTIEGAMSIIAGTARSMGIEID